MASKKNSLHSEWLEMHSLTFLMNFSKSNVLKIILKLQVAQEQKTNRPLLEWSRDVVNHFWHCADISKTKEEFVVSFWFKKKTFSASRRSWPMQIWEYML